MDEWLLQIATRLTRLPWVADFAYGGTGRFVLGTGRRLRMFATRLMRVPVERFNRTYFSAKKVLQFAVTNVCNARCTFCAYRLAAAEPDRPTGVMSMAVFKKGMDEYAALGGQSIDLTPTVGDPLLDPTLVEKVKYTREKGITDICLTTNAIAFRKRDLYKHLIDTGATTICISIPGMDAETYRKVYGTDRYAEALAGTAALLRYNHERGEPARVILRFRNPDKPSEIIRSKDFVEHIKPFLSRKVSCNFTVDYDNWGGSITQEDMHGVMRLQKTPPRYNVPCMNLFNMMVKFDGSVRLCGCRFKKTEDDELVVGSIMENSLSEIGKSDAVHKIIDGFYHGKRPSTCEECSFYAPISEHWMKHVWKEERARPAAPQPSR